MTATDPPSRQLSEMAECAYRLGMAFGAATEKAQGTDGWLAYFNAFDRCFFAVRVATALQLRLNRALAEPREGATDREALIDRSDALETLDPETDGRERDRGDEERERDRDTERASLPILLRTLEEVADEAETLPGPEPAELPTLRELIAHAKATPSPAGSEMAQSRRFRLSGSVAALAPVPPLTLASNVGQILAARRAPRHATGPPRR